MIAILLKSKKLFIIEKFQHSISDEETNSYDYISKISLLLKNFFHKYYLLNKEVERKKINNVSLISK